MQHQTIALQTGQRLSVAPVKGADNRLLLTVTGRDRQTLHTIQLEVAEAGLLAFALETMGESAERATARKVQGLCVVGEVAA